MVNWSRFPPFRQCGFEMIYFDNNATTAVAPEVLDAMMPYLTASYGNPSSAHSAGIEVRTAIDRAREQVAALLGTALPEEIAFTSCGTESDNWAILGGLQTRPNKNHIITTRVEHEAVRKPAEQLEMSGFEVTWLETDESGLVDLDQLRDSIKDSTALVSMMLANNETGVLFPVVEAAEVVKDKIGRAS